MPKYVSLLKKNAFKLSKMLDGIMWKERTLNIGNRISLKNKIKKI